MVFNKTGKKAKNLSFSINNHPLEIAQEYTYLGVKITTSGSFNLCQKALAEKGLNALFKIHKQIDFFRLSLRSSSKIFDTVITPILTYGAEIWGIFSKFDFEKWDQTPAEKVHLRFCKLFLGLNRKASNYAVRGEMGRIPLQIVIIKQILRYNIYLNSKDDDTLVKQFLNISQEMTKQKMNSYSLSMLNLLKLCCSEDVTNPKHFTEDSITTFISALTNKYKTFWRNKIETSTKLDFYRNFKHNYTTEAYLDFTPVLNTKRDYTKFRMSNHKLAVEKLRYTQPIVPREQRLCEFCDRNEIEDENHLLFSCNTYEDLRETYFNKMGTILNINPTVKDEFVKIVFNTSNRLAIVFTSNFISKCFLRRKSLLQSN